ncbi:sulfotransferase [Falsirhodobacter deserti]|uniref:sulfotransferase n=1 Tax=Falsirhodobacter deserti TaxID=1365611 RepID=UPI000FE41FD9|nr:sulfotransferase [Falsirhodobacter deserti]
MSDLKRKLIVSGVARSGTTALAELLNSHEGVCVGIERFKFQFLLRQNYSRKLFSKERFFRFEPQDTNLRPDVRPAWVETYERMAQKWDDALIVGDKVPDLTPILPDFIAQNPGFRYIYILRNLRDVGLSWQARANRTRDPWPATKDFAAACESWSTQYAELKAYLDKPDRPDNILLLDYDRMFAVPDETERTILSFLDLPQSAAMRQTLEKHSAFAADRKPRKMNAEMQAVHDSTDKAAYDALCQMAHQAELVLNRDDE